jgi:biotin synthase
LKSIAKDIIYLKSIPVDMVEIAPFVYHPDSPIENTQGDFLNYHLKLWQLCVYSYLIFITAMGIFNPQRGLTALQVGANVITPNVAETTYRKCYEIYPGKICLGNSPAYRRIYIKK